jgi:hypothetical protein
MLATFARHAGLMNAMSCKAGVNLGVELIDGRVTPTELRHGTLTCMQCENVDQCERFLFGDPGFPAEVPDYCLNKDLIDRLK